MKPTSIYQLTVQLFLKNPKPSKETALRFLKNLISKYRSRYLFLEYKETLTHTSVQKKVLKVKLHLNKLYE